ncbi:MAG: transcription antitermination factor NusB [Planctomycetota bacterium]|nr:transcription antitermination factor NusB [Planctomycetota bacterium]
MTQINRAARTCAVQALFQFDCGRSGDPDAVRAALDRGESPGSSEDRQAGFDLAVKVWSRIDDADAVIAPLSTEWPTQRQPRIDRNLLRLGWYELKVDGVPAGICINDAVEIAKEFASEKSASFVNAILDQINRGGAQ